MQCSMHKKWIALGCTRQVSQVRVVKRCNLTLSELQLNIVSGVSSDADWCYLGLVSRPEQQWSQDQWSPNTSQFSACSPGRHMSVRMEEWAEMMTVSLHQRLVPVLLSALLSGSTLSVTAQGQTTTPTTTTGSTSTFYPELASDPDGECHVSCFWNNFTFLSSLLSSDQSDSWNGLSSLSASFVSGKSFMIMSPWVNLTPALHLQHSQVT